MMRVALLLVACAVCAQAAPTKGSTMMNMGGVPYQISNPPGSIANWKGQAGEYPTNFMDDQAGEVDYFDVYGEVQTHYSQVRRALSQPKGFWRGMRPRGVSHLFMVLG